MTHNNYKDFFKDPQFILWRLTLDETLNEQWENYRKENPSIIQELDKAIQLFDSVRFQQNRLDAHEEDELLVRIHTAALQPTITTKHKQINRWNRIAIAASILLVVAISSYFVLNNREEEQPAGLSADLIVGENLEEKEIYLISDNQTTSFSNDIHIELDENGSAVIRELSSGKSELVETSAATMNKLVVPYGKQSQLVLADGTKVWINSGSVLEFPSSFAGKTRAVNLIGEMYIEVAKDDTKPFFVNTQQFQIKVYGTKFNVSAYNDDINNSVVLVEGSVGVQGTAKEETHLRPSDMLTVSENEWKKTQVDVSGYTSWKDGYLSLNQTPIDEVLRQVARFYNLTFDIGNSLDLQEHTCTGKLVLSEDLDNVMTTISLLSSTKYTRDEKRIYIDINPQK